MRKPLMLAVFPVICASLVHCSAAPQPGEEPATGATTSALDAPTKAVLPVNGGIGAGSETNPAAGHAQSANVFGAASVWSHVFCRTGEECRFADVNGDGKADILAFTHNATPQVYVGISNGSSFGAPQRWSNFFCQSTESCEVGDVNGDGLADIVAFTRGTSHSAWIALSNGSSFGAPQQWSNFFCLDGEVCKVADVNNDRKADLIAFTHNAAPKAWVGLSNGAGFAPSQKWSDYFCTSTETCDVGDVNGDGSADILAFTRGTTPRVWVSTSTGGAFAAPQKWSDFFCLDGEECRVADVDGDRKADILAFTHNAAPKAYVGFSEGASFDGPVMWDDYFCTSTETCAVADVNGDGTSDAIAVSRDPSDNTWVGLAGINTHILNHGGPVMGAVKVYYVFYGNFGGSTTPAILTDLASSLGGSPYWNINTTYGVPNSLSFGGSAWDWYSHGTSLADADIPAIVNAALPTLGTDPNGVYLVVTSQDVNETSGLCTAYCGWHTYENVNGTQVKYGFIGSAARCPSACAAQWGTTPNGNPEADGMASVIAHELEESASDPLLNGWFAGELQENGDICAWSFGTEYTTSNGAQANVRLGARDYLIQRNFVNGPNVCAMSR
jgi:hypothetical protein